MHEILRPVWAEIDLGNFRKNVETVRSLIPPTTRILAVVKANAYGIGAVPASKVALSVPGVEGLAVATPEEAMELREAGIDSVILVLGPVTREATAILAKSEVSVTVTGVDGIRAAEDAGASCKTRCRVHLKIDTGMGRIGFRYGKELDAAIDTLLESPHVEFEGIFTHFAAADTDKEYTEHQLKEFRRAVARVREKGLKPKYVHAANSAAIMDLPDAHLDLVRPGIMLYGCYPDPSLAGKAPLYPVLSLHARVTHVKTVPPGTYIGYGKTFRTTAETTIATIPIGYADGYPRMLSNRGTVLIGGKRYPIAGRVCMDQLMVDVGVDSGVKVGDKVTLIGSDGDESITPDDIAELSGTISHEILTGISARVPRKYIWPC